ncbi:MAG TPA: hypothetical protein VGE52_14005, partial [Pirellulales bacterium]
MRYVCLVVVLAIVAGCSKPAPKKIVAKPKPAVEAEADPREAPVPGSSEEMIARANRVDAAAIAAKDSDV